ncbi:class II aldolase/adducin family protein [Patescibacteria group bacterium]|nr:class II aldolase/adducin family protein [Patescibacteria group bacterium]MCL5091944.1 class II aldolase/adducin family protein [Patescibacteria group bacterium]
MGKPQTMTTRPVGRTQSNVKEQAAKLNRDVFKAGLVYETWGTASVRDGDRFIIKPSGFPYKKLRSWHMVTVSLNTGKTREGELNPSIDTKIHKEIYNAWPWVGAIIHTHSTYATAFATAGLPILLANTTMADYYANTIPLTGDLSTCEVDSDFETNIGKLIIQTFKKQGIDPRLVPAVLHKSHGPFVWGETAAKALVNAKVLEKVAEINCLALRMNPDLTVSKAAKYMFDYHNRRHNGRLTGGKRNYGQEGH